VRGKEQRITEDFFFAALIHAIREGAKITNLSLSPTEGYSFTDDKFNEIIDLALSQGCTIVCSAGNCPFNKTYWPKYVLERCIVVRSVGQNGGASKWGTRDTSFPCAFGESIFSIQSSKVRDEWKSMNRRVASWKVFSKQRQVHLFALSGTSQSAAIVSSIVSSLPPQGSKEGIIASIGAYNKWVEVQQLEANVPPEVAYPRVFVILVALLFVVFAIWQGRS
jgi:hypothetical protein